MYHFLPRATPRRGHAGTEASGSRKATPRHMCFRPASGRRSCRATLPNTPRCWCRRERDRPATRPIAGSSTPKPGPGRRRRGRQAHGDIALPRAAARRCSTAALRRGRRCRQDPNFGFLVPESCADLPPSNVLDLRGTLGPTSIARRDGGRAQPARPPSPQIHRVRAVRRQRSEARRDPRGGLDGADRGRPARMRPRIKSVG